jgi:hypothetical protein
MAKITITKMRKILKRLGLSTYYEHIPHILSHLIGIPAPVLTRETEERIRAMFKETQAPYQKYRQPGRKNFLSYNYVFHKFFQLLDMKEFLPFFPFLKSRQKNYKQDIVWKKICNDLGWKFYRSQ